MKTVIRDSEFHLESGKLSDAIEPKTRLENCIIYYVSGKNGLVVDVPDCELIGCTFMPRAGISVQDVEKGDLKQGRLTVKKL